MNTTYEDQVLKTAMEQIKEMKFDVVVGNPPYQLSNADEEQQRFSRAEVKRAWLVFLNNALVVSNNIAMVVPSSWLGRLDKTRSLLLSKSTLSTIMDATPYFNRSDVAIDTCVVFFDENYDSNTKTVMNSGGTYQCDWNDIRNLQTTAIAHEVLQKSTGLSNMGELRNHVNKITKKHSNLLTTPTATSIPVVTATGAVNDPLPKISHIERTDINTALYALDKWKVVFNTHASGPQVKGVGPVKIVGPNHATTDSIIFITCNTEEDAITMKDHMTSPLARFIIGNVRASMVTSKAILSAIPAPDQVPHLTNGDIKTIEEFLQ